MCVCVWEERADIFSLRGYRQLNFGLAEVAAAAAAAARGGYVHRSIHSSSLFSASSVFVVPQRCSSTRFFHFLPSLIVTSNERVMCARLLWPYSLSLSFISALLHPRSSQCSAVQCSAVLYWEDEEKEKNHLRLRREIKSIVWGIRARREHWLLFHFIDAALLLLRWGYFESLRGHPATTRRAHFLLVHHFIISPSSSSSSSSSSPFCSLCVCVCGCMVWGLQLLAYFLPFSMMNTRCWLLALGPWLLGVQILS